MDEIAGLAEMGFLGIALRPVHFDVDRVIGGDVAASGGASRKPVPGLVGEGCKRGFVRRREFVRLVDPVEEGLVPIGMTPDTGRVPS